MRIVSSSPPPPQAQVQAAGVVADDDQVWFPLLATRTFHGNVFFSQFCKLIRQTLYDEHTHYSQPSPQGAVRPDNSRYFNSINEIHLIFFGCVLSNGINFVGDKDTLEVAKQRQ